MIWGAIGLNRHLGPVIFQKIGPGHGNGMNAQQYINQVLVLEIRPYFQQHANFTLPQDNACTHTARITMAFVQQHNIKVMPWPSMVPIWMQLSISGTVCKGSWLSSSWGQEQLSNWSRPSGRSGAHQYNPCQPSDQLHARQIPCCRECQWGTYALLSLERLFMKHKCFLTKVNERTLNGNFVPNCMTIGPFEHTK